MHYPRDLLRRHSYPVLLLLASALLVLALAAGDGCAGQPEKPAILMQRPVRIIALPGESEPPDVHELIIRIESGRERFRFTTRQRANSVEDAIDFQKQETRWEGHYLLVGYDRGGGNASRISLDVVFSLRQGKLLYLGEVEARSNDRGSFRDTYNKFESNGLTSHAEAPMFPLILEERGDRLQVNLDRTWRVNLGSFRATEATIRSLVKQRRPLSGPDHNALTASLLFSAVLAKYCQRHEEFEKLLKSAPSALDRNDYGLFKALVAEVIPGELPQPEVSVITERQ